MGLQDSFKNRFPKAGTIKLSMTGVPKNTMKNVSQRHWFPN